MMEYEAVRLRARQVTSSTSTSETTSTSSTSQTTSTSSSASVPQFSSSSISSTPGSSTISTNTTSPTSGIFPASNTTISNSTISASGGGDSGISSGAIAGAAVGAFVAGLAIAGVVLLLIFRRKLKGVQRHPETTVPSASVYRDHNNVSPLAQILLEPASESDLKGMMGKLYTQIEQHVANNYDMRANGASVNELASALGSIGYETPAHLAAQLANPATRNPAITSLISWKLFSAISPKTPANASLLPPQIAALSSTFASFQRHSTSGTSSEAYNRVLSQWRPQTAYLLQTPSHRENRNPLSINEQDVLPAINAIISSLNSVLSPYISSKNQVSNLRAITFEVAKLGLLLFSQAATYVVDWSLVDSGRQSKFVEKGFHVNNDQAVTFVVYPSLCKTVDAQGGTSELPKTIFSGVTSDKH